ncbi:hypothetical protein CEXT_102561 [Caerostris extrusa]|uniref:Uncharacterized protein n=1 Tax=Caerostris extrusa TaxID=172846 RepID=A0AAV4TR56_CAEEX|nr:hypothetical protein CEXT_102561 [Caerostris extrusa]
MATRRAPTPSTTSTVGPDEWTIFADGHGFRATVKTNEPGTAASAPAAAPHCQPLRRTRRPVINHIAPAATVVGHAAPMAIAAPVAYGGAFGHGAAIGYGAGVGMGMDTELALVWDTELALVWDTELALVWGYGVGVGRMH